MRPLLANLAWLCSSLPDALPFRRATSRVEATQWNVLRGIIAANATTEFGRRHDFPSVDSVSAFQQRVPISTADLYAADIARAAAGQRHVLTRDPITHFMPTSGTTAAPKLIPFTRSLQRDLQRAIAPWIVDLFQHEPALLRGTAYWSISPALPEERTTGGIPIGFAADDEYFGRFRQQLVASIQSVPADVAGIADMEAFRYATLYFLATDPRLSLVSIWNPTFLMLLLAPLRNLGASLVRDIATGTISPPLVLDALAATRLARAARARRSSARAREVERALRHDDDAELYAALWPRLRVISCWMDAHAAQPARELAALFPQARMQPKGLLSTEGFVSFPMTTADGAVLAIRSHFFEFAHADAGAIVLAHQLQQGRRYDVVLTTSGGLYRHPTGDRIEVPRFFRDCPVVRFVGRESYVDYFGEKLSDAFVGETLASTVAPFRFAMLARDGDLPVYTLFIESSRDDASLLAATRGLEDVLRSNIHYRYCRDLGQLQPLRLYRIERNGSAAYLAACVARGQRAGDVKPVAVHGGQGWSSCFDGRWI